MRVRPVRRLRAVALAGLASGVLAASTGCTLGHAQARPSEPDAAPPTATASATATASGTGDGSRVVARVDVDRPGGGSPGVVTVTLGPEGTDVTALNSLGESVVAGCGLSDGTTRWVPFQIDFADHGAGPSKQDNEHTNLAATVEVRTATGGAGSAGVLLASGIGNTAGCNTPGVLPATDSFSTVVISGGYHVQTTGYVVARVPAGGAGRLAGATLAVTALRKAPDDIYPPGSWDWQVQKFETGQPCPDTPASVCVPLG